MVAALTKIRKMSNPRYREKVEYNKRNNLDWKGKPINKWDWRYNAKQLQDIVVNDVNVRDILLLIPGVCFADFMAPGWVSILKLGNIKACIEIRRLILKTK